MVGKITYEYVSNFLKEKGLQIVSSREEFEQQNIKSYEKKFKYQLQCNHIQETTLTGVTRNQKTTVCQCCKTYDKLKQFLTKQQVTVLSTKDDFCNQQCENVHKELKYQLTCGHQQEITWEYLSTKNMYNRNCNYCNQSIYNQILIYLQQNQLQIITTQQEFDQQKIKIEYRRFTYKKNNSEDIYETNWQHLIRKNTHKKIYYFNNQKFYDQIVQHLEQNQLQIATTYEDFEQQKDQLQLRLFAYRQNNCQQIYQTNWERLNTKQGYYKIYDNYDQLFYGNIVEFLQQNQLKIITTWNEFIQQQNTLSWKKFTYQQINCSHTYTHTWYSLKKIEQTNECYKCRQQTYENVQQFMTQRNLRLISQQTEFESDKNTLQIEYIAQCGHIQKALWRYLKNEERKEYFCHDCKMKKANEKILLIDRYDIENQGIELLKQTVQDQLQIIRCQEGNEIDILIKSQSHDLYLKSQIKVTQQVSETYKSYKFHKTDGYNNMLLILISLKEKQFWILQGNDIQQQSITISQKGTSKYNQYLVDINQIQQTLLSFFKHSNLLCNFEQSWLSSSSFNQIANNFIKIRESKLDFIKFIQPSVQAQVVDFYIDSIKFQEKVSSCCCKNQNSYSFNIQKSIGELNRGSYVKGDNDYYWFNINQEQQIFYVIPEQILINKGYIKNGKNNGRSSIRLYVQKQSYIQEEQLWKFDYQFSYQNIDKDKLINLIYKN